MSAAGYISIPTFRSDGGDTFFTIKIQTPTYKATCEKTYGQFTEFDTRWRTVFSTIPYTLTGGGLTLNSQAPDYSEKRRIALEAYMQQIITVAALRCDIADFLNCDERVLRAPKPGAAAAAAQKEAEKSIAAAAAAAPPRPPRPSAQPKAAAAVAAATAAVKASITASSSGAAYASASAAAGGTSGGGGGDAPPVPIRRTKTGKGNAPPPQPPTPPPAEAASPPLPSRSPPAALRQASSAAVAQMNAAIIDAESSGHSGSHAADGDAPALPARKHAVGDGAPIRTDVLSRAQAVTGLVIALFMVLHMAQLAIGACGGGTLYDLSLSVTRLVYQNALSEMILIVSIGVHMACGVYRIRERLSIPPPSTMLLSIYYHRRTALVLLAVVPLHILLMRVEPSSGARGSRASNPHAADYVYVQYVLAEWWFPVAFLGSALTLAAGLVHASVGITCALRTLGWNEYVQHSRAPVPRVVRNWLYQYRTPTRDFLLAITFVGLVLLLLISGLLSSSTPASSSGSWFSSSSPPPPPSFSYVYGAFIVEAVAAYAAYRYFVLRPNA